MTEHMTEEERNGGKHINLKEKAEEFRQKARETEEQLTENLDNMMNSTAEKLEKAAEKMHETAEFFKSKNVHNLKKDASHIIKKNPMGILGGALFIGFLIGKTIFK